MSIRSRFDTGYKVDPDTGCWLWTKLVDRDGYGRLTIEHIPRLAHRVSWQLHNGPVPDGICVCHRCDVPGCVNPDHLFTGTHDDNMGDMAAKGRAQAGEDHSQAKLNWEQVREIRARYSAGCLTMMELGAAYGVSDSTICKIVNGNKWKEKGK